MTSYDPNGIPSHSPGLRGTSYPGFTVTGHPNPNGVASSRAVSRMAATPLGLMGISHDVPRVVALLQPWAECRSPVGAKMRDILTHLHHTLNAPSHPIRQRLDRISTASPDLLAIIKQEGTAK